MKLFMKKYEKIANLLMSMALDYLQGGITDETFLTNLKGMVKYMEDL